MKKLILEQLLGDKPTILESQSAKSSEEYDLLYRQEMKQKDDYAYKYNYGKKTSRKLSHCDQLIFLRIFKVCKKKYKNISQLSLVMKLKEIFKDAVLKRKFEFISFNTAEYESRTKMYNQEALKLEEKEYGQNFLNQIGLSKHLLINEYGYQYTEPQDLLVELRDIAYYITYATPLAIIQMNKRLKKQHKK
jgi:hypothetical protein